MDRLKSQQTNSQTIVSASCERAAEALSQTSNDVVTHVTSTLQKEIHKQVSQALDRSVVEPCHWPILDTKSLIPLTREFKVFESAVLCIRSLRFLIEFKRN